MKAKSIKGKSPNEIGESLKQSMADGFKPTLAIIFISIKQDRDAICKLMDEKNISVYGATTNGEFIDEEIDKESIAVLLLDINTEYFKIFFEEFPNKDYRNAGRLIAKKAQEKFAIPAFLIAASNIETDAEELLHGFEDVIGNQVNVFGCMAGDDFSFTEQFVFTNKKSSNRGILAIALDEDKIEIQGIATCSWKPMGTKKLVTKSIGNRIYTVDGVPILELTKKYSGIENFNQDNPNLTAEISVNFPLQLQRANGSPVMRPGVVIWEDGSFICSGSVPQGAMVRFSLPPDFDVIEKVVKGIEDLKATKMPVADAVIVYNCGGRLMSLGPLMTKEIEGIKKVWNVPLAGMFSNAELGRATDGNLEMHNLTNCCVALKEK